MLVTMFSLNSHRIIQTGTLDHTLHSLASDVCVCLCLSVSVCLSIKSAVKDVKPLQGLGVVLISLFVIEMYQDLDDICQTPQWWMNAEL